VLRVAISVEQNWNAVPGGTARSTNRLISELLKHDALTLTGLHGRHRSRPTLDLPPGLSTTRLPLPGRVINQTWNRWARPSIDRWVSTDVVHAPAYSMPPSTKPTVATIHDLAFRHYPEWFTRNGVGYMEQFLDRVMERRAWIVAPSSHTADDCVSAGFDRDRISVVPWGVDRIEFAPGEVDEVCASHGVAAGAVVFVGTREPRKNLDGLARAMAILPHRQLVVIGPVGWGEVTVEGASVLGELDDRSVRALMAAAGVLVYPSHFEGFGLPVLEAMSQGTAVVTTSGSASAEVAAEGGLAVDTTSPEALAGAIGNILEDQELRARLGAAGTSRAERFSWEATAQQTLAVYRLAAP